jgi:hypothetical protein
LIMKTEIDQNGKMTISPESELEAYALKSWAKESMRMIETLKTTAFTNMIVVGNYESQDNG